MIGKRSCLKLTSKLRAQKKAIRRVIRFVVLMLLRFLKKTNAAKGHKKKKMTKTVSMVMLFNHNLK